MMGAPLLLGYLMTFMGTLTLGCIFSVPWVIVWVVLLMVSIGFLLVHIATRI